MWFIVLPNDVSPVIESLSIWHCREEIRFSWSKNWRQKKKVIPYVSILILHSGLCTVSLTIMSLCTVQRHCLRFVPTVVMPSFNLTFLSVFALCRKPGLCVDNLCFSFCVTSHRDNGQCCTLLVVSLEEQTNVAQLREQRGAGRFAAPKAITRYNKTHTHADPFFLAPPKFNS